MINYRFAAQLQSAVFTSDDSVAQKNTGSHSSGASGVPICNYSSFIRSRTTASSRMLGMPPTNSVDRLAAVVAKRPM